MFHAGVRRAHHYHRATTTSLNVYDVDHNTVSFNGVPEHGRYEDTACLETSANCILWSPTLYVKDIDADLKMVATFDFDFATNPAKDIIKTTVNSQTHRDRTGNGVTQKSITDANIGIVHAAISIDGDAYLEGSVSDKKQHAEHSYDADGRITSRSTQLTGTFILPATTSQCKTHTLTYYLKNGGYVQGGNFGVSNTATPSGPSTRSPFVGKELRSMMQIVVDNDLPVADPTAAFASNIVRANSLQVYDPADFEKTQQKTGVTYTSSNLLRFEVDGWHDTCKAGLIHKYVIKICRMLVEGAVGQMKLFEDHEEENCVLQTKTFYASRALTHDEPHLGHVDCAPRRDEWSSGRCRGHCLRTRG